MFNVIVSACSLVLATGFAWQMTALEQGMLLLHATRLSYLVDPDAASRSHCTEAARPGCRVRVAVRQHTSWTDVCLNSRSGNQPERYYRIRLTCSGHAERLMRMERFEITTLLKR